MDWRQALSIALIFGAVALLSGIASRKIGDPDTSGAVAAAVSEHYSSWIGVAGVKGDSALPPLTLCLESKTPLNLEAVAGHLAHTIIRAIPIIACRSERVEGDFGMFASITRYYDFTGEEAAHLEIAKVACSNTTTCQVDIDDRGAGMTYELKRRGQEWQAVGRHTRWIV